MAAKRQARWQQIKQHRVAIIVTTAIIMVAIALIFVGYRFDWAGFTGYTQVSTVHTLSGSATGTITRTEVLQPGKTIWDWLQLLIIPIGLAIIAFLFNRATTRTEQNIVAERYEQDKAIAAERYEQDRDCFTALPSRSTDRRPTL